MSKSFSNGQSTYDALKDIYRKKHMKTVDPKQVLTKQQMETIGEQSIRDNNLLVRLLPAGKTEKSLEDEKFELQSRIDGFDLDKELEKDLVKKGQAVIIAPLSMNFKNELIRRSHEFTVRRNASDTGFFSHASTSAETGNTQEKTHACDSMSPK